MARIKGKDTSPELAVRKALTARGIRYRLHLKTPGGKADLVIPSKRFALFVDGCFWHGCPEHYVRPRSRDEFWAAKLRENVDRDRRQVLKLLAEGWTVLRIWEHEVLEAVESVIEKTVGALITKASALNSERIVRVDVVNAATNLEKRHIEDLLNSSAHRSYNRVRQTRKRTRSQSLDRP